MDQTPNNNNIVHPLNKITKEQAIERLWNMGNLSWMLDSSQKELYDIFHNTKHKTQTWMLPRRFGKTRTLCILAIEQCIKTPMSIVKFLSPTKKQVERNIRPIIREILETCPESIKPDLKQKDDIYYFVNGSEIQLAGSEAGNIDTLRGGYSQISIVDEAQDVSDLTYAINSVLLPTTLTTKGKILLAGTPPKDSDHDFLDYVEEADAKGILVKRTIYDNPRLSPEDIKEQADAMGGVDSEDFKREFLCAIIKSTKTSIIPEFTEEKEKKLVQDWEKPTHYNAYISMDLGFKDWTVVLFGYYDFKNDKTIIEDEIVTFGNEMHLPVLAKNILDKQEILWTNPLTNELVKPKKLVSDHDLIAINEIKKASQYKLMFVPAEKEAGMQAGVNFLRVLINNNKLIISPKCITLIRHLKNGRWAATARDTFGRCPQGSHYDAIAAAVYFVRAIDYKANPYPKDYAGVPRNYLERVENSGKFYTNNYYKEEKNIANANVYRQILGLKKK